MSYPYYQQASPVWGTNQYQFGPPPTPSFQSQPTWGGMDFYSAHAPAPDPSLFDRAWNRVRDHTDSTLAPPGIGVGTHEARHWHRRAYGGVGELTRMLPTEIGHAAAYEAYRTWIHNSSIREPLSGDLHRQREGLIGLAVAEASRLLPYAGRQIDNFSRTTAAEAAAATASIIFYHGLEGMDGYRRSRSRSRYDTPSSYNDPYAYDDAVVHPRRRSHSNHRSHSHSRAPVIQIRGGGNMPGAYVGSAYAGSGYSGSGYPGYTSSMHAGVAPSYSSQPASFGSYSSQGMPMNIPHGSPYPQAAPMGVASSYPGSHLPTGVPLSGSHRERNLSISYPQNSYPASASGMMTGQPQGQTIVVPSPSRKHKHRHHRHRSHSRSGRARSISPYESHYPEGYPRFGI